MWNIWTNFVSKLFRGGKRKADGLNFPVNSLTLQFLNPNIVDGGESVKVSATALLLYSPGNADQSIRSFSFTFEAPIGDVELQEIRWYIERYHQWPTGVFKVRAEKTENALSEWGEKLFTAMLADESTRQPFNSWLKSPGVKQLSIEVVSAKAGRKRAAATNQAASHLLALPWELLHNGADYLSSDPIYIRRTLAGHESWKRTPIQLPLRVLLLSPRPECSEDGQPVGYLDHRSSALPLIQAMENLGETRVKVDVLNTPTLTALQTTLAQAKANNTPYAILHFDGHGIYDPSKDMGALCFEQDTKSSGADDLTRIGQKRLLQLIYADELAEVLRALKVPLIYLDACQTAQAKDDPRASVAAKLLEHGVGSVVAMSHSVLVATASRFVEAFYRSLANGLSIGAAMLAGRNALCADSNRFKVTGAGNLELQDWFVPVLFQQGHDPVLIEYTQKEKRHKSPHYALGHLPEPPKHTFVGRSYTLLQLERLLQLQAFAVIQAGGGLGKTAIAVELAHWLVRSGRIDLAVFVCVEPYNAQNITGIVDLIGRQVLPKYTVALYGDDLDAAIKPILQVLQKQSVIILLDNMESVLPDHDGVNPTGVVDATELMSLCQTLLQRAPTTKLLFTTRETLPAPFNEKQNLVQLGRLSQDEAITLVERVMAKYDKLPPAHDDATTPEQIIDLVEAVHCHPRALVLLAMEIDKGVNVTTENITSLMVRLEEQHPGDRENSLFASVELSLRRLPREIQHVIRDLTVLGTGAHLGVLSVMLKLNREQVQQLISSMESLGLAELSKHNFLRFDPALFSYLTLQENEIDVKQHKRKWAASFWTLIQLLYERIKTDPIMVLDVTRAELPNIMRLLDWLESEMTEKKHVADINQMTRLIVLLLKRINHPAAIARAEEIRLLSNLSQENWDSENFDNEKLSIERLAEQGQWQKAIVRAEELLEKAVASKYLNSEEDIATAHRVLGGLLKKVGKAQGALHHFTSALSLLSKFCKGNDDSIAVITGEQADCLYDLGLIDASITKYREVIELFQLHHSHQNVAVGRLQLSAVLREKKRYFEALEELELALTLFKKLNDETNLKVTLHKLGTVYCDIDYCEEAENAYLESLKISTSSGDEHNKGIVLSELGILYGFKLGRTEEALDFFQSALDIAIAMKDLAKEGFRREQIAQLRYNSGHYDEAKKEIERAIYCAREIGNSREPWAAFELLKNIEMKLESFDAALEAWSYARDSYLSYRKTGVPPICFVGELAERFLAAIKNGKAGFAANELSSLIQEPNTPIWGRKFVLDMIRIVQDEDFDANAIDFNLDVDYTVSAELMLFQERYDQLLLSVQ